jgi:hypothetical protein
LATVIDAAPLLLLQVVAVEAGVRDTPVEAATDMLEVAEHPLLVTVTV